jgi:hypothetical protein
MRFRNERFRTWYLASLSTTWPSYTHHTKHLSMELVFMALASCILGVIVAHGWTGLGAWCTEIDEHGGGGQVWINAPLRVFIRGGKGESDTMMAVLKGLKME